MTDIAELLQSKYSCLNDHKSGSVNTTSNRSDGLLKSEQHRLFKIREHKNYR